MRSSVLGLIAYTRFDVRKDIKSLKPTWSFLHAVLKPMPYPVNRGIIKDIKLKQKEKN